MGGARQNTGDETSLWGEGMVEVNFVKDALFDHMFPRVIQKGSRWKGIVRDGDGSVSFLLFDRRFSLIQRSRKIITMSDGARSE